MIRKAGVRTAIGMALALALGSTPALAAEGGPWFSKEAKARQAGRYADVNGIKLYYEVRGTGAPPVLLHGGLGAIEMFGRNLLGGGKKDPGWDGAGRPSHSWPSCRA